MSEELKLTASGAHPFLELVAETDREVARLLLSQTFLAEPSSVAIAMAHAAECRLFGSAR